MDLGTVLTLIGIIIAVIGIPWYLRGKIAKLDTRLGLAVKQSNGLLSVVSMVIGFLHESEPKIITDKQMSALMKSYAEMARVPETSGTPLTEEERATLDKYLAKAHRGEFFSADEVTDYNSLVAELERQKKDDPSVWPLIALGAFLAGLFLASRK